MRMRRGVAAGLVGALMGLGVTQDAEAIVVTFDAGAGSPLSYTESGLTVTSLFAPPGSGHLHLGDNSGDASPDLQNHGGGCCSSPYEFTYSGGAFTLVSVMLQPNFGLTTATTLSSNFGPSVVLPGVAAPTLYLFAAGFSGTSFTWNAESPNFNGNAVIDDLQFTPAAVPEPGTLLLLGSGLGALAARRRRRSS